MGLSQSIVIRSEFSVPDGHGGGSRGATPGRYVLDYMSRDDKVESLAPARLTEDDDLSERYDARLDMIRDDRDVRRLPERLARSTRRGGVAMGGFPDGSWDVSMSHRQALDASRRIQRDFEEGRTVIKTVVSFTEDYLRDRGVLREGFSCDRRGAYRGNVDQLKLRNAIVGGMDRLGRTFDALMWVGVVHVDTRHVHCHLAMVDEGPGRMAEDGTQRGKLSARQLDALRSGVDDTLLELTPVHVMTMDVGAERDNVRSFVKRAAYEEIAGRGFAQLLVASLPDDGRPWRFGTGEPRMARADALARAFVGHVLDDDASRGRVVPTDDEEGERIVADCADAVYDVVAELPRSRARRVGTAMSAVAGSTTDELAASRNDDPAFEFGLRTRVVAERVQRHASERRKWRERVREFDEAPVRVEAAWALRRLYAEEEEYHAMLLAKYRSMLAPTSAEESLWELADEVGDVSDRLVDLAEMAGPARDDELDAMSEELGARRAELMGELVTRAESLGLSVTDDGTRPVVERPDEYPLSMTRALDLHDLDYDFPDDVTVPADCVEAFEERCRMREQALGEALDYLRGSGQQAFASMLPVDDVSRMRARADELAGDARVEARRGAGRVTPHRSVSLDDDHVSRMREAVLERLEASVRVPDSADDAVTLA